MNEINIAQLQQDRRAWVDMNKRNGFEEGIANLLTELYPDNAHFIYELLQNAEDTGATKVKFELNDSEVRFTHNGKSFDIKDVHAITSIGQGTKANDVNKIGKFGVGFKAVFSYAATPIIYSKNFSFRIEDLVVPVEIDGYDADDTLMIFPFNSETKTKEAAYGEIKKGLLGIQDNTLLFLSNIHTIEFALGDKTNIISRDEIDDTVVSITNRSSGKTSRWLRFKKHIPNSEVLFVSIAFKLERDEKNEKDIVVPVNGEVSIFFPAEKETSKLKFHIHAPFASTVARDSIKDIEENKFLRDMIVDLLLESLEYIKENGLLDFNFLRCLPIDDDYLENFYAPIQEKVVEYFNHYPCVQTDDGQFKPAQKCYRGSTEIKKIVDIVFLKILLDADEDIFWIRNPQRNSREDKFLSSLQINSFENRNFVEYLQDRLDDHSSNIYNYLKSQLNGWFGLLYAFLYKINQGSNYRYNFYSRKIILLTNGNFNIHEQDCYFSTENLDDYCIVKKETYISNNEVINENSKLFLESLGVREVDEEEKIKTILRKKYAESKKLNVDNNEHINDIRKFIKFFKETGSTSIFKNYHIIMDDMGVLRKVNHLIIDEPYAYTEMKLLYNRRYFKDWYFTESHIGHYKKYYKIYTISNDYYLLIDNHHFVDFLKELGAINSLEIIKTSVSNNMEPYIAYYLYSARQTSTAIDSDWTIRNIGKLLEYKDVNVSRLIWNTLRKAGKRVFVAQVRPNKQHKIREARSQLIQHLESSAWIPDIYGKFHSPKDMSREMLPKEFVYDDRNGWLTTIGFGQNIRKSQKEYQETDKILPDLNS